MSAPTPVDVQPVAHMGPSVAEIAGRVVNADPVAQAKISFGIHQKHGTYDDALCCQSAHRVDY